jgi:hypothetical protein
VPPARGTVALQSPQRRLAQIGVQRAYAFGRAFQNIRRPRHWVRGDRCAAGQAFQQHEAERVGHRGEHEHVGAGIGPGQRGAVQLADESCLGVRPFQRLALRPIADDHFDARQIERQEPFEVLLDGDAAHIQEDGARQRWPHLRLAGLKPAQVHPSRPGPHVTKTAAQKLRPQAAGRHHGCGAAVVESPQQRIAQTQRDARARMQIFREPRVERGRERHAPPQRPAPRRPTQWSLCGHMQRVGAERLDQPGQAPTGEQGDLDAAIGRQVDGPELVGTQHLDLVAHRRQFGLQHRQRPHHAVDLRMPGVGDDQNPHRGRLEPEIK